MIYVDDSGDEQAGSLVYGWVEVSPDSWRPALRHWLEFRKRLSHEYGIPVRQELHTTAYVGGRGEISIKPPARFVHGSTTYWKDLGREVATRCLEELRDCDLIDLGAVYRKTDKRRGAFTAEKAELYGELVRMWDAEHTRTKDFALISMDGNAEPAYISAHRSLKLDTRHVIEDPMFHDSRRSQWTQMADLVAWTAQAHVNPHGGNEFAWRWYEDFLIEKDPMHGPWELPA